MSYRLSRRRFLQAGAVAAAGGLLRGSADGAALAIRPLEEVGYEQVALSSEPHLAQLENTRTVLMGLSDDGLLKPFREMAGQPAPGESIGGWYEYLPDFNYKGGDAGLAPGATFGQWVSALSRMYAISGDQALRERVVLLNRLYAAAISTDYFAKTRFPAYSYDKLVCGLMDSHRLAGDKDAVDILSRTTDAAIPELPGHAVEREIPWRSGKDVSWNWDESYTLSENLYLVSTQIGAPAGQRYRKMAEQYLDDAAYFDPLARGENVLGGRHAYSYVNALNSAMQAYMVDGSAKHLLAARNAFDMLQQQSFATGGWGPDELLRKPGSGDVFASLTKTHNSFETPCGSYAHMKLTRFLLRCTRQGRYGDSMERVMYNTVLGALPLEPDGTAFYYSDYNFSGRRVDSTHRWPCCSGTLPQVAADYGINTYFRELGAVWVNLYVPSTLRWSEGGTQIALTQTGSYPDTGEIRLRITSPKAVPFRLMLRVPAWATGARVTVNGRAAEMRAVDGFCAVKRTWKSGDVVELELPMRLRIEPFDQAHPETVAMMYGPRVLFPLTTAPIAATREQLLAAQQTSSRWTFDTASGAVRMAPFTAIGDEAYSTYMKLV
jgi:DUF1680 family protein